MAAPLLTFLIDGAYFGRAQMPHNQSQNLLKAQVLMVKSEKNPPTTDNNEGVEEGGGAGTLHLLNI